MSVIFIVVPLAAVIVLAAVIAFVWSARHGQFDDLDTPSVRVLHDEWESSSLACSGVIPGPLETPMRQRTHPGDETGIRRAPESLVPVYLELLTSGKAASGRIVDAAGS